MTGTEIEELISAYRARVGEVTVELGNHFEVQPHDLLAAKNRQEIPATGKAVGLKFRFHGVGLWVGTSSGRAVDFDWGPNGELGGFDSWRLRHFATTNKPFKRRTPAPFSEEEISVALEALRERGAIEKRGPGLGDHLYFLTGPGGGEEGTG